MANEGAPEKDSAIPQCVFCGARKNFSNEDIIPKWLQQHLDIKKTQLGLIHDLVRSDAAQLHLAQPRGGASLEEVSAAIGHSSPVVTQRFYNRFRRTTFSPTLRTGLDLGANKEGAVIPFAQAK